MSKMTQHKAAFLPNSCLAMIKKQAGLQSLLQR